MATRTQRYKGSSAVDDEVTFGNADRFHSRVVVRKRRGETLQHLPVTLGPDLRDWIDRAVEVKHMMGFSASRQAPVTSRDQVEASSAK